MSNLLEKNIPLRRSKKALFLFGSLYGIGILSVVFSDVILSMKCFLVMIILADGFRVFMKKILLCSPQSIISLYNSASRWYYQEKSGKTIEITLKQLISFRKVIIVRFTSMEKNRVKTLFLFDDNTLPECFHYLLVQTRLFKNTYET